MGKSGRTRAANEANLEAARIQTSAAERVAELQSSQALEAAEISSAGQIEAARISSEGSLAAAHAVAGATAHAASLQHDSAAESRALIREQTAEAVERSGAARDIAIDVQNEQFGLANERLQPYAEIGETALPEVERAGTLQGFADRLTEIAGTDAFSGLSQIRQRAGTAAAAAGGLLRSGAAIEQAADIDTELALGLDSALYGRQLNNVNIGRSAVSGLNSLGANYANNIGNIETSTAALQGSNLINSATVEGNIVNQASANIGNLLTSGAQQQAQYYSNAANAQATGVYGAANAQAQGLTNAAYFTGQGISIGGNAQANALQSNAQNYLQESQNRTNAAMAAAQTAGAVAAFFCDARYKENIKPLGQVADLTFYEWDWKKEIKGKPGAEMTRGFMAQQVLEKYPDCVKSIDGILAVDYGKLKPKLQERLQ